MRFQPGQSGNPAGRPPGSPNKKTLALEAAFADRADEILNDVLARAKNGEPAAMRMCMERMVPPVRERAVAIELPVIKTPEDAELALTMVTDELAAGNLTIGEASRLVALIDRMPRVAERMWKFARARRYSAKQDASFDEQEALLDNQTVVATGEPEAPQTPEKPAAPLYSPVNSQADGTETVPGEENRPQPGAGASETEAPPLPRAA